MIFKVLFQENPSEVPVRERTSTIYVEADSQVEVRKKLAKHNYNIEVIQGLTGAHLEYEQKQPYFVITETD